MWEVRKCGTKLILGPLISFGLSYTYTDYSSNLVRIPYLILDRF